ncbi:hypothetical protein CPC08DRAFT_426049 [Agrocybe pediades]|nr:hypothetical protein CPC08DRAFT_426049 [Agrocybe pediades]
MCISVQVSGRHGAPASNNETSFLYDFVPTSAPSATSTTSGDMIVTRSCAFTKRRSAWSTRLPRPVSVWYPRCIVCMNSDADVAGCIL